MRRIVLVALVGLVLGIGAFAVLPFTVHGQVGQRATAPVAAAVQALRSLERAVRRSAPWLPQETSVMAWYHAPQSHHVAVKALLPHHAARKQHSTVTHVRRAGQAHLHQVLSDVTIVIPRLHVQAPVFQGSAVDGSLPIVDGYGVTHWRDSADPGAPGNYIIYGHDDIQGEIFRYLPTMQPDDRIYLHRGKRVFVYRVTGSRVVWPDDVSVLDDTPNPTITMISCTPYWVDTQRIVVTGVLIAS